MNLDRKLFRENALHIALKHGDVVIAKILIENGADIHYRIGVDALSPLHVAIESYCIKVKFDGEKYCVPENDISRFLMQRGADIFMSDLKGDGVIEKIFKCSLYSQKVKMVIINMFLEEVKKQFHDKDNL